MLRFLAALFVSALLFVVTAHSADGAWKVGDKVEVEWSGTWYKSTILEIQGDQYKIHYDEWDSSYDETVEPKRIRAREGEAAAAAPTVAASTAEQPAAAATEAPAASAAASGSGAEPDESKDMMGLNLQEVNGWTPSWDADTKVAMWEKEGYMPSIVIRMVGDKLDTTDELKAAGPMMMQLGTAITAVGEQKTTPKGWWTIVTRDKNTDLIYVQKYGKKTLVCSASLTPQSLGDAITQDEAVQVCETISVK